MSRRDDAASFVSGDGLPSRCRMHPAASPQPGSLDCALCHSRPVRKRPRLSRYAGLGGSCGNAIWRSLRLETRCAWLNLRSAEASRNSGRCCDKLPPVFRERLTGEIEASSGILTCPPVQAARVQRIALNRAWPISPGRQRRQPSGACIGTDGASWRPLLYRA